MDLNTYTSNVYNIIIDGLKIQINNLEKLDIDDYTKKCHIQGIKMAIRTIEELLK